MGRPLAAGSGRLRRPKVDVQAIRRKHGLTREEFAERFNLSVRTIEAWEQGRRRPDTNSRTLLAVISIEPELVRMVVRALAREHDPTKGGG